MWFPIDDKAHASNLFRKLPLSAIGLYAMAGSYCMDQLTDGFVPDWFVSALCSGARAAKSLICFGIWIKVDGGYQFIDWPEKLTKAAIELHRQQNRKRVAQWREAHGDEM